VIPPIEYEPPFTVGDVIGSTDTDGWAVARNGTLLTEQYFGGMTTETSHLLMSVSKSIVGAVVGILNGAGLLDIDAPVCAYVPALA
ncbi:serine hydrolase domain-containing protein, partial [Klebsiella pneumoniae]|uniref:serine hydrolase n=1 Tax=Klebsiella pneumoniae TaxID=573 RepID=UPI002731E21A